MDWVSLIIGVIIGIVFVAVTILGIFAHGLRTMRFGPFK